VLHAGSVQTRDKARVSLYDSLLLAFVSGVYVDHTMDLVHVVGVCLLLRQWLCSVQHVACSL